MSDDFHESRQDWDGQDHLSQPPAHDHKPRFDPTINLGHVLTFVGFMIAGFGAWTTLDKRVTVIEERVSYQAQIDRNQDSQLAASMLSIKEALGDIKLQVARLGERFDGYRK